MVSVGYDLLWTTQRPHFYSRWGASVCHRPSWPSLSVSVTHTPSHSAGKHLRDYTTTVNMIEEFVAKACHRWTHRSPWRQMLRRISSSTANSKQWKRMPISFLPRRTVLPPLLTLLLRKASLEPSTWSPSSTTRVLLSILRRRRVSTRQIFKTLISLLTTSLTTIFLSWALPPLRIKGGSHLVVSDKRKCKCTSRVNGQHGEPGWT